MTHYIVTDNCGMPLLKSGDVEMHTWMHSTAKPFQLLPLLERNIDRKFALSAEELVLLSSSHLAQPQHLRALQSILEKTGLLEDDLIFPPAAPSGKISYQNWQRYHGKRRKIYHPCAGNHMAIMLLQRELTGSAAEYQQMDSPAQQEIFQYIKNYTGEIPFLKLDNCGIPTYGVSLCSIASAYQKLGNTSPSSSSSRFVNALHTAPVMVEGDGCISTILCSDHNLIAKTGVNYLLALCSQTKKLGVAIISNEGWESVIRVLCEVSPKTELFSKKLYHQLREIFL